MTQSTPESEPKTAFSTMIELLRRNGRIRDGEEFGNDGEPLHYVVVLDPAQFVRGIFGDSEEVAAAIASAQLQAKSEAEEWEAFLASTGEPQL